MKRFFLKKKELNGLSRIRAHNDLKGHSLAAPIGMLNV